MDMFIVVDLFLAWLIGAVLTAPAFAFAMYNNLSVKTWEDIFASWLAGTFTGLLWPWWFTLKIIEKIK